MDSGASSHMASDHGNFDSLTPSTSHQSVTVGNGATIPITHIGSFSLTSTSIPLHLHNILIVPQIIKNLISVHQFTTDNSCSVEFDPYGFSVKDLLTGTVIILLHYYLIRTIVVCFIVFDMQIPKNCLKPCFMG